MAMSKKDFIALADMIREVNTDTSATPFTDWQVGAIADFCQSQNPRFDRKRWLDYIAGKCGPNGGTPKPKRWKEDDPHGPNCAMRLHSAAECTCGKLDVWDEPDFEGRKTV